MKHILTIFSIFLLASVASAQTQGMPQGGMPHAGMPMPPGGMHPGRPSMETTVLKASYPDSTAFNAEFKELYPLIKPTPNIKERTETMLAHMSNMFKGRGIDSAKAHDSVMKGMDYSMDEKLLFTEYRANFTAEELKTLIPFFKSASGKHYLEVESHLVNARSGAVDSYVNKTVNKIVMPMGKPIEAPSAFHKGPPRMEKPGMPVPPTPPPPAPEAH